jgi:hypothetical protein
MKWYLVTALAIILGPTGIFFIPPQFHYAIGILVGCAISSSIFMARRR